MSSTLSVPSSRKGDRADLDADWFCRHLRGERTRPAHEGDAGCRSRRTFQKLPSVHRRLLLMRPWGTAVVDRQLSLSSDPAMVVRSGFNCRRPGSVKTTLACRGAVPHRDTRWCVYRGIRHVFDSRLALHYETSVRIVRLVAAQPRVEERLDGSQVSGTDDLSRPGARTRRRHSAGALGGFPRARCRRSRGAPVPAQEHHSSPADRARSAQRQTSPIPSHSSCSFRR